MKLSVTAVSVGRERVHLPSPVSMDIVGSLNSPAVNFAGKFALEEQPLDLAAMEVAGEWAVPLFSGTVDRQRYSVGGGGRLLEVEARNVGGLLLDNEARPQTLWAVNMITVFNRLISPYGFVMVNPNPSRTLEHYTIYKGVSEWEAFRAFVWRMHHLNPYVSGGQVMVARPAVDLSLTVSNRDAGAVRYSAVEHNRVPYEVISRVYLRDEEGLYSSWVDNAAAAGIQRKRYVIPGTEYEGLPGLDARGRIQASMLGSEEWSVTVPELVRVIPGQRVLLPDFPRARGRLVLYSWRYRVGKNGMVTELTLRNADYI